MESNLIKCIRTKEEKAFILRRFVAEVTNPETNEKVADISTNYANTSFIITTVEGDHFAINALDVAQYVLNNKEQLIAERINQKEKSND